MRKSAELIGLPIIALQEAKEVGKVRDLVIDPAEQTVQALLVEDSEWFRNPKALLFSSLRDVGQDAVMVESRSSIFTLASGSVLDPYLAQPIRLIGTRVLNTEGRFMGKVTEFSVNTEVGKLAEYEITSFSSSQKPITVPSEKIRALTHDLLLVEAGDLAAASTAESHARVPHAQISPLYAATAALPRADAVLPPQAWSEMPSTSATQPARASEQEDAEKIPDERQDAYLLGKEVRRDIISDNGVTIVKAGEIISPEIIQKAKEADKYLALSFSIRRS